MSTKIQAIRGMNDILPEKTAFWRLVEQKLSDILIGYGYQEIRLPLLEKTALFQRVIGEVTDIVEKEMYTFEDRNGESLSLRPEGTAGCVRAMIEHGLLRNTIQKIWYNGAMFRHERPQQGRYRQFHQIGVEVYGLSTADIDAEILLMTARFWQVLGLKDLELQINSLGSSAARATYREKLVEYFSSNIEQLDEDSRRRLNTNPLRILDSKNPDLKSLIENAPKLLDYLDKESKQHFEQLQTFLNAAGLKYTINPRLVRGLDYYNKTVFEWVTNKLGSQGTVCAGGRYNGLVEQLGGSNTPAIGFALGLERLIALLEAEQLLQNSEENQPHIYLMMVGDEALMKGLSLAEQLRNEFPQLRLITHCGGGNFKNQFKKADKSGAKWALIVGETELANQQIGFKYLREEQPQQSFSESDLINHLKSLL
jgi:histidyl-tRNA synthetase